MVVICGGYGRGKVSRWKTKLNLKNDQKPKQPIVSNKSRLVSFAGQVTGFLGPKACASSSNVRAQCVIPSYPRSERVPKHKKRDRETVGNKNAPPRTLSCLGSSNSACRVGVSIHCSVFRTLFFPRTSLFLRSYTYTCR